MNTKDNMYQNHIYYRIVAAGAVFLIHVISLCRIPIAMNKQLPLHPELKPFYDMGIRGRYATVWNMMIQMVYTLIALRCDLSVVLNKESMVSNKLKTYRNTLFYGLVFPVGMAIATVFWPYFIYDRELILPKIADYIMSPFDNFMVHGLIAIYALFELAFIPRESRKDISYPKYLIWFNCLYIVTMFFTRYVDVGLWPYAILSVTEDSLWLYLVIAHPPLTSFFFYYIQGTIQDAIWKHQDNLQEKNN